MALLIFGGQPDFGRARPIWANFATRLGLADLGNGLADFWWPDRFGPTDPLPRFGPPSAGPLSAGPPSAGPPFALPPSAGPPSARTAQNFALFFLLPLPFSFFPLSGGLLVEFWSCFGRSGPQMCLFSPSGCPVKPRRPAGHPFYLSGPHPSCPNPFWVRVPTLRAPHLFCFWAPTLRPPLSPPLGSSLFPRPYPSPTPSSPSKMPTIDCGQSR